MAAVVGICQTFGKVNRMWHTAISIDAQMLEDVVVYLLLVVIMRDDIPIELCSQLIANCFDIHNIVADLNWLRQRYFTVFLLFFFARFGNQIAKIQQRLLTIRPADATFVRTWKMVKIANCCEFNAENLQLRFSFFKRTIINDKWHRISGQAFRIFVHNIRLYFDAVQFDQIHSCWDKLLLLFTVYNAATQVRLDGNAAAFRSIFTS